MLPIFITQNIWQIQSTDLDYLPYSLLLLKGNVSKWGLPSSRLYHSPHQHMLQRGGKDMCHVLWCSRSNVPTPLGWSYLK